MSFRRGRGLGGNNGRFGGIGRDDGGGGRGRGGRDGGPQRLSNYTSDASMAGARVFIGNLPTSDSRLTKTYLEERFSQYGTILGMSILKGFGFIQYAEESSAEDAIRGAHNSEILGHRVDVKHAKSGKDGVNAGNVDNNPDSGNFRDRSPIRVREPDPPLRDFPVRDREWNFGREMDRFPESDLLARERDLQQRDRDPFMTMIPTDTHRKFHGPVASQQPSQPLPNEIEIIATSKSGPTRQYAERIENRLKNQGFIVDILFPHEDIPLRKVLADLSNRGTLFAVVVTPVNEEHGSVSLNILFGQPEEHRNMPVEDAFTLLSTSYKRHKGLGIGGERKIQVGGDAHPANVQLLINFLQENRPLTVLEYDRLIRYLNDKRDRQARLELGEDPPRMPINIPSAQPPGAPSLLQGGGMNPLGMSSVSMSSSSLSGTKSGDPQSELQQRILSILNAGSAGGVAATPSVVPPPVPVPAPHPVSQSSTAWGTGGEVTSTGQSGHGPMLNDPTVQKALDSLIQTGPNLLKNYPANTGSLRTMASPTNRGMQNNYYPSPNMVKRF